MSRKLIFSARKKDFDLEWFSGTGAGGQHRNKHQNCCRIRHKETGIQTECAESRSREQNKKIAFHKMVDLLMAHYFPRYQKKRGTNNDRVRTYHMVRGTAKDHKTGLVRNADDTLNGDLDDFIEARQLAQE